MAGGGTGGHLFPALAVAEALRELDPGVDIHFVGSRRGIEARELPALGWPCHFLTVRGLPRRLSAGLVLAAACAPLALLQALGLVVRWRPAVVVGTGGYASGPAVAAALLLGIPAVVLEQNLSPGLTTRWLARFAREVHVSFPETRARLARRARVAVTGNPVRGRVLRATRQEGTRAFGLDPARRTLLVLGGSRGARGLNRLVAGALRELAGAEPPAEPEAERERDPGAQWGQCLFQCGAEDRPALARELADLRLPVQLHAFIPEIGLAYAASDLVLCRAGATTVAELTARGLPALLVPYPWAAAGHQEENARWMERAGAARVFLERDTGSAALAREVRDCWRHGERLAEMARASSRLGRPDAAEVVARSVLALARARKGREPASVSPPPAGPSAPDSAR